MGRDADVDREDFEEGVRHVADTAMRSSLRAMRVESLLRAVVRALAERGELDVDAFERALGQPPGQPAGAAPRLAVALGKPIDKYAVASPPDLDCAALFPVCQARCCMLVFPLTPQDLDEGRLAWRYHQPYEIAHAADERCVHQDRATGGCTVYEQRPAICRHYDCRQDPRIWLDFERRIPAPLDAVRPRLPVLP
jgi:hypothetical protein